MRTAKWLIFIGLILVAGGTCGWGTPGQNVLSFNGSSVAENLYVVDGLNVSNFSQGLGSTFVPMAFIEEVQVKTGGIEAEFGRTTGGVVNMVTKSGSNTLRGTADLLWNTGYRFEESDPYWGPSSSGT
jgi:outer membrane receptor protein involved in Fe transport